MLTNPKAHQYENFTLWQKNARHGNVVIFIEVHDEAITITKQDGTFPLKAVVKTILSL